MDESKQSKSSPELKPPSPKSSERAKTNEAALSSTQEKHSSDPSTSNQEPEAQVPEQPPIELLLHSERTCKWLVALQLALTLALALALVLGGMKPPEDRLVLLLLSMFYSTVIVTVVVVGTIWKRLLPGPWKRVATQVLPYVEFALGLLATYSLLVQMEATTDEFVARIALVIAPFPLFLIYQLRKGYAESVRVSGTDDRKDQADKNGSVDVTETDDTVAHVTGNGKTVESPGHTGAEDDAAIGLAAKPVGASTSEYDDTREPVWRRLLLTFLLIVSVAAYITGIVLL